MEKSLLDKYLAREYTQTTGVIVLAFISLWSGYLESTALVTIVGLALGVYGAGKYAEKKLEAELK
jgi:lipopolysaccharide export LptBFGC system permease protein LptF